MLERHSTDGCFPSSRTLPNLWGVAAGDGHLGAHYITGDLVRKDGVVWEAKKDMKPYVWEPKAMSGQGGMTLYNLHPLIRYLQNRWLFASPKPDPPPNPDGAGAGGYAPEGHRYVVRWQPRRIVYRRNGKVICR